MTVFCEIPACRKMARVSREGGRTGDRAPVLVGEPLTLRRQKVIGMTRRGNPQRSRDALNAIGHVPQRELRNVGPDSDARWDDAARAPALAVSWVAVARRAPEEQLGGHFAIRITGAGVAR